MIKAKEHLTVFTMVLYPMTKVTGITTYSSIKSGRYPTGPIAGVF